MSWALLAAGDAGVESLLVSVLGAVLLLDLVLASAFVVSLLCPDEQGPSRDVR